MQSIVDEILEHQELLSTLSQTLPSYLYTAKVILQEAHKNNKRVYVFGNAFNTATAQTIVLLLNEVSRKSFATSLCSDAISLSFLLNEYGGDFIFEKQIAHYAQEGDILVGLSNSGASKNILRALSLGRNIGCKTIGLSGGEGGFMGEFCDVNIVIPSNNKLRIQEMFGIVSHIITRL